MLLILNIPLSSLALSLMLTITSITVIAKVVADAVCVFITYWISKRFVFVANAAVQLNVRGDRDKV